MSLLDEIRAKRPLDLCCDLRGISRAQRLGLIERERPHIEAVLREFGGDVGRAAKCLGLSRTALYRRLYALGIAERKVRP